mgnify:CR=1 FL=1
MKKHFLDEWIKGLKAIRYKDIRAYRIPKWPSRDSLTQVRNWTEESISFLKAVNHLNNERAAKLVNLLEELYKSDPLLAEAIYDKATDSIEFDFDDGRDEGLSHEDMEMRREKHAYWVIPTEDVMKGSSTKLENSFIFSVEFTVTGMLGWTWGWVVRAFSPELAFVSEWDADDCFPLEFNEPIGVVTRENLYKSIALLFINDPVEDASKLKDPNESWGTISPKGDIHPVELYRLLLAATGIGKRKVLDMDKEALMKYKAPGAKLGYYDFAY